MLNITPESLFLMYDELLNHSVRMLTWARENRWTALIAEEADYVATLDRISSAESSVSLSAEQLAHKNQLLEKVLSKNEETYRRLLNRRRELDQLLSSTEEQPHVPGNTAFEVVGEHINDCTYLQ
ncbi:MAG: flagellar protein FliT [Gammaproteobacteria bacterium]|nr:MAG: flagellar protein FliT [Gammaproteobacteria bacterium]